MAVPKRRQSKMKSRLRRTHYIVAAPTVVKCASCGEPTRPHTICPSCGNYRGRNFVNKEEIAKA